MKLFQRELAITGSRTGAVINLRANQMIANNGSDIQGAPTPLSER